MGGFISGFSTGVGLPLCVLIIQFIFSDTSLCVLVGRLISGFGSNIGTSLCMLSVSSSGTYSDTHANALGEGSVLSNVALKGTLEFFGV